MLIGREAELAAVMSLCETARAGRGGALVVRGVAGSGKSTLLAHAVDTVATSGAGSAMRVLSTSGVESESPLAFAALQRLLRPLRSGVPHLPGPQRDALQAALGEGAGTGDRFVVFLATLSLLADASEEQPLLIAVDDAQWLDEASAAALLFVARRLQAEPVALLFAARDGTAAFDAADLPAVTVGAMTDTAAARLVETRAGLRPDPAVLADLLTASGGNPLALVELAGVLTADQLTARQPLPSPLPLTGGVERAFLDRCRRLSEAAQRVLLVTAADDTARLTLVREASERLGAGEDALEEAELAGLVRVDGDRLALHHPLVRSAVYQAATSAQRRATHRALAQVLAADPDRQAWHLAAAADRPDESVVMALDGVAERAANRGGHEAAAAAWARAAELTAASEPRGRRLVAAASAAWLGGQPARAAALASTATADVSDDHLRARLLTLRGQIEWNTRSLDDGYDLVLQAAQTAAAAEGPGGPQTQQLAMLAASLAAFGAHSPRRVDLAALAGEPADGASTASRAAHLLLQGFLAVADQDWALAADGIRAAWRLTDAEPLEVDHVLQPNLGIAALHLDDDARGLRTHADQLTAARGTGALTMVEHALTRGVLFQLATGAWGEAGTAAAEALQLATSTGQPGLTALPRAELAVLAALRGDQEAADRHIEEVTALLREHPIGITRSLVEDLTHWARGLRAGQPPAAVHHLRQVSGAALRRTTALDRLEAAVRADRADLAQQWLAELTAFGDATGVASAVAAVEHGRALRAENAAAEAHFRAALAAHARSLRLPDRARTELAYGEWLRRSRRRVDARQHLRTALAAFEDLGATRWAERAAQELRASGETARRRDPSTASELTAQERQVASLVRQGLSNKDAAAQLFVSPRTVDFHLRNVFAKLNVSSRAELAALALG